MYEYADRVTSAMSKRFVSAFNKCTFLKWDELHILSAVSELYSELDRTARECLKKIAERAYRDNGGENEGKITSEWLLALLSVADPVTKYAYTNEVDRKKYRFIEAIVATSKVAEGVPPAREMKVRGLSMKAESEKALKLFDRMIRQYALMVTDKAAVDAYKDMGYEYVRWVTAEDEKVCKECGARHDKVYPIDNIPPKPHLYCRCIVVPYRGDDS